MNIRFDGKTAIVTGSARGIGYACADLMAESGAKVAMLDILGDRLEDSAKKLQAKGGVAKPYAIDLTKTADVRALVTRIRKEMGEIDVLIQVAALGPQRYAEDITEEEWDKVFDINSKAYFFMSQAVTGQSMIPRKTGSIVNFCSIAGLVGMRAPLCSHHYSASKGAVAQITKQGAIEWARHGIRVNAVAPGGCLTEMTQSMIGTPENLKEACALVPLGRLSQPHEVASGVVFLASDAASMITGQILVIDGGGFAMGF